MGIVRAIELLLIVFGALFVATEIILPLFSGGRFFPSLRKNSGAKAVAQAAEDLAEVNLHKVATDISRQADRPSSETKRNSGGESNG